MPLAAGSDRATISRNIAEMMRSGYPQNVAVAASLHNADRTRAMGGGMPGMAPQPMGSIGHMMPGAGIRPAAMPNHMGMHLGMHPASVMPHRDDGGAVGGQPAQPAPTPGLQPNSANANPLAQSYIQRFASMSPEQLQELIGRLSGSPLAGIAQRVLQQKRLMPAPVAPTQTAQPTPLATGGQQQAFQQPPQQQTGMQPVQQAARGGQTKEKRDTVPILAAGGEFIVSPEHVARMGEGDIQEGHRRLDRFVIERRKQIIKEMKALRGPVGSKES